MRPISNVTQQSREGPGLEARPPSLNLPRWAAPTQRAHGQGWLDESQGRTCGPGTVTQLMNAAINTFAFPTAPTCLTWLPFLPMSGPGAGGQAAWACAENITCPPPLPGLAQGPPSTSGSHTELQVYLLQAACPDHPHR